jgi:hypothetical protein
MAEELYESDARAQKAWRRVLAAVRKLAKREGEAPLADAVATASHGDASIREMRRYEALAELLEAVVAEEEKPAANAKTAKRESE